MSTSSVKLPFNARCDLCCVLLPYCVFVSHICVSVCVRYCIPLFFEFVKFDEYKNCSIKVFIFRNNILCYILNDETKPYHTLCTLTVHWECTPYGPSLFHLLPLRRSRSVSVCPLLHKLCIFHPVEQFIQGIVQTVEDQRWAQHFPDLHHQHTGFIQLQTDGPGGNRSWSRAREFSTQGSACEHAMHQCMHRCTPMHALMHSMLARAHTHVRTHTLTHNIHL